MMTSLKRIVFPCWKSSFDSEGENSGDECGRVNGLLWYKDSGRHVYGEYSMAVIQANATLEDQSQLESGSMSLSQFGPHGTFVGIYDGHGGAEAARFINNHLFDNIKKFTTENEGMSETVIKKAFVATEEEFLSVVREQWQQKPQMASVGSCCLVGIICGGNLYVANSGDSRAVLGRLDKDVKEIQAVQLSNEHNANLESVRDELHFLHPDDPQIVVLKHHVWRVKGIIQVSRSIGDAYLKRAEFNKEPLLPKFRLPQPFDKPILEAKPQVQEWKLESEDHFIIFASDGLWEHLSNQEAVDIVQHCPHNGVARKLVTAALKEAAKKREMRYSDLKKVDRGVRRHFHDDITVIVLFIDSHLISQSWNYCHSPSISIRGTEGLSGYAHT
ncbi:Phosphoprotein phosphatase [Bertholletia excelsa]